MGSIKSVSENALWRKASHSVGNGACVEVASLENRILVRDSTVQNSPMISYPIRAWHSFLGEIKAD